MEDLYGRFLLQQKPKPDRPDVARDRDRIIHASALRRLQGKSQIVGVGVGDFFRTRLTHSLECAQIGRAIASRVTRDTETQVVDPSDLPDLVEAACLAHDLGHPPFGHNGEKALQECMRKRNGSLFEGNAQSFRTVTFVEPKRFGVTEADSLRWVGLDLTRATLRAILKYPSVETPTDLDLEEPKFGVYDDPDDREYSDWVWDSGPVKKSLGAEIMDVADDIAYAVHDLEDGVWARMIPLFLLLQGEPQSTEALERMVLSHDKKGLFLSAKVGDVLAAVFNDLDRARKEVEYLREAPFDGTKESRAALKGLTSSLIDWFITAVSAEERFVEPTDDLNRRLAVLKGMAWTWMIDRSDLATHQYGQRLSVAALFEGYWEKPEMLPRRDEWELIRERDERYSDDGGNERWPAKARLICDHIAGMTDAYALHVHAQMYRGEQARESRFAY